ncbi:hypothetical protein D9758_007647 [Tetrapyrgos nigripes]|uniref:Uncharacterized protein n=1 Tax=Tetrapyrgos nigripes TaxID=182062 RepID=A0A8H5G7Y7_9AGAR|nr:hypothetical protein D9758_007647 [Tetrapyrgos nigripes]
MLEDRYCFDSDASLDAQTWSRFHSVYSNRVRMLRYLSPMFWTDQSDLSTILRNSVYSTILTINSPKLRELEWRTISELLPSSTLFMHDKIEKFSMAALHEGGDITNVEMSQLWSLVKTIPARMPFLTSLKVEPYLKESYVAPLVALLNSLPNLAHFATSTFHDISPFLLSSGASRLRSLEFSTFAYDDWAKEPTCKWGGPFPDGSYPAFVDNFAVCVMKYNAVSSFFQHHNLNHLKTVTIKTLHIEKPAVVRRLFQVLSRSCPALSIVHVDFHYEYLLIDEEEHIVVSSPTPTEEILAFDGIEPMLHCKNVTDFSFIHQYPTIMTDSDLETMAIAWKNLKWVALGYSPWVICTQANRPTLSRHCPEITEVSLLFDTKSSNPSTSSSPSTTPSLRAVPKLKALRVCTSELDLEDGGRLLCQVCDPQCKLEWTTHDANTGKPIELGPWKTIKETFPVFFELYRKAQEREDRINDLERLLELGQAV